MEHIIRECIEKLFALAANPSISPDLAAQAGFLSAILNEKLSNNDLDAAAMMICSQCEQMEELSITLSRHLPFNFDSTPRGLFRDYFQALNRAGKELKKNPNYTPSAAGVAIIHRIWLGKLPSEEDLKKVTLSNKAVERHWIDYRTNQKPKIKKLLWTNVKTMLNDKEYYRSLCGSEIMDISSLFDSRSKYYQYVYNFIARGEYAFASDMLRFMILEQYGGLYLGFRWTDARTASYKRFKPTRYSLIFLTMFHLVNVMLESAQKTLASYSRLYIPYQAAEPLFMDRVMDSEITYCGHKHNYFFTHVLNTIIYFYESTQNSPAFEHVKAYRTIKYKTIRNEYKLEASDDLSTIPKKLQDAMKIAMINKPSSNIGILTNVRSFCQAMIDLNYVYISMKHLFVNNSNCFATNELIDRISSFSMYVEELGIGRNNSVSWTAPNLKDRFSVEK